MAADGRGGLGTCLLRSCTTRDAWWHLRSGQWILENRRLPTLDPFTFASADREWIDLHWGFQIPLALAYRSAASRE